MAFIQTDFAEAVAFGMPDCLIESLPETLRTTVPAARLPVLKFSPNCHPKKLQVTLLSCGSEGSEDVRDDGDETRPARRQRNVSITKN